MKLPVTILTGFLGSGKTTLLNHILHEKHGRRIAVIENEFGEANIDNAILLGGNADQIIEMSNGCLCCTVHDDLVRMLGKLREERQSGNFAFERLIIETTGLADPGPVAQTFFMDASVADYYRLDAIITVVDAKHADLQLDDFEEAQEQVGFADRILLSKTDLVSASDESRLRERLLRLNPRAPIQRVHFGRVALHEILDIHGFDLDAVLAVDPAFLESRQHQHDDAVRSFVFRSSRPFDRVKLEDFLSAMIQVYGPDMLRCKGLLHVQDVPCRLIFQGIHGVLTDELGRPWAADERRTSVIVFIGRRLPQQAFIDGLDDCLVKA